MITGISLPLRRAEYSPVTGRYQGPGIACRPEAVKGHTMDLITEIVAIALTAAPWLLVGLVVAGLAKAFLPEKQLRAWVGGSGLGGVTRAAVIGVPLPLCSCGAIPTAVTLHRGGAGRGPTTAFLIGTPGVGVDSVAITYALLGPFMMLARVVGAVITAVTTGWLVSASGSAEQRAAEDTPNDASDHDGCCEGTGSCCGNNDCGDGLSAGHGRLARLRYGLSYAFGDLYDEIGPWMLVGLALAGVLTALVPTQTLSGLGAGPLPIMVMAVIGIPLYVCATAATPVAAGLLVAGMSPGAVITFLIAGPVTSLATLGVLRREMGNQVLVRYLLGIVISAVGIGLTVDGLSARVGVDVAESIKSGGGLLPVWLKAACLVALVAVAIRPLRRLAGRWTGATPAVEDS